MKQPLPLARTFYELGICVVGVIFWIYGIVRIGRGDWIIGVVLVLGSALLARWAENDLHRREAEHDRREGTE